MDGTDRQIDIVTGTSITVMAGSSGNSSTIIVQIAEPQTGKRRQNL